MKLWSTEINDNRVCGSLYADVVLNDGSFCIYKCSPRLLFDSESQKEFIRSCNIKQIKSWSTLPMSCGLIGTAALGKSKSDWYNEEDYNYDDYKKAEAFLTKLEGALKYRGINENFPESVVKFINMCFQNGIELSVKLK